MLTNTSINDNTAKDGGQGGGIVMASGGLAMSGGSLAGNAAGSGGALVGEAAHVSLIGVTEKSNKGALPGVVVLGSEAPTALEVSGGSATGEKGPAFTIEGGAGTSTIDVSGTNVSGNSAGAAAEGCPGGVCVVGEGLIRAMLSHDTFDHDTSTGQAPSAGAVLFASQGGGGSLTLSDDSFDHDAAAGYQSSGAVDVVDLTTSSPASDMSVDVTGSKFTSDGATGGGEGGAVGLNAKRAADMSLSFSGDTFADDTVRGTASHPPVGGALDVAGDASGSVTGTTFSSDAALSSGSEVAFGGAVADEDSVGIRYSNDVFSGNEAKGSGGGVGGALLLVSFAQTIQNCAFTGNVAATTAGAIYDGEGLANISDSTFSGNTAGPSHGSGEPGAGGAILAEGSVGTITNSTFTGNVAFSGSSHKGDGGAARAAEFDPHDGRGHRDRQRGGHGRWRVHPGARPEPPDRRLDPLPQHLEGRRWVRGRLRRRGQ